MLCLAPPTADESDNPATLLLVGGFPHCCAAVQSVVAEALCRTQLFVFAEQDGVFLVVCVLQRGLEERKILEQGVEIRPTSVCCPSMARLDTMLEILQASGTQTLLTRLRPNKARQHRDFRLCTSCISWVYDIHIYIGVATPALPNFKQNQLLSKIVAHSGCGQELT